MDKDKKRSLVFGVIIILAISGSLVYFFWGNFINRGTLEISGEAPFNVEVYGQNKVECGISPCRIKLKSGSKDLIVSKENHRPVIRTTDVNLWRTTNIHVEFPPVPQITETESLPAVMEIPEYVLLLDKKSRMQKLVDKNDRTETAIVYFPQPINNPLIINGSDSALLLDQSQDNGEGFIVDTKFNTRQKISNADLKNLTAGYWSGDGAYLVFQKKNSSNLWLLNSKNQTVDQLDLTTIPAQISWIYNDSLIFVTDQSYKSENDMDIKLLNQKSFTGLTFGIYDPFKNTYQRIETFSEINQLPDKIIATENGQAVYFQLGAKNFKIELR